MYKWLVYSKHPRGCTQGTRTSRMFRARKLTPTTITGGVCYAKLCQGLTPRWCVGLSLGEFQSLKLSWREKQVSQPLQMLLVQISKLANPVIHQLHQCKLLTGSPQDKTCNPRSPLCHMTLLGQQVGCARFQGVLHKRIPLFNKEQPDASVDEVNSLLCYLFPSI